MQCPSSGAGSRLRAVLVGWLPAPLAFGSEFQTLTPNYRLRSDAREMLAAVLDTSQRSSIGWAWSQSLGDAASEDWRAKC